jgi:cyclophilin family peptidyl-prolyl cis-trans isomerase
VPNQKRQRKKEGRQARLAYLEAQRRRAQRRKRFVAGGVALALIAIAALAFSRGGDDTPPTDVNAGASTTSSTEKAAEGGPPKGTPVPAGKTLGSWTCPKADGSSERHSAFPSTPPPMCIDPAKTYTAKLDTTEGPVEITLDTKKTPNTVNSYVVLSRYKYYDGTVISRIDDSIDILQTGSPSTQSISDPGPGYKIKDEGTGFKYSEGDVTMARSSGPDSGGAQYFFVVGPKAAALDGQGTYVTFGKVTKGLDVLKTIAGLFQACGQGDQSCLGGAPSRLVTIKSIQIVES